MFRILVTKIQSLRWFSGVAFAALLCATPFSTAYAWDRSPGGEPPRLVSRFRSPTSGVAVGPCQDEDPIKDAELYALSRLNKFLDTKTLERVSKVLDTYQKAKHAVDGGRAVGRCPGGSKAALNKEDHTRGASRSRPVRPS